MIDSDSRLQRYKTWVVGSEATDIRQQAAFDLETDITNRRFSASSLEDLIVLLNHEFLCVRLGQDSTSNLAGAFSISLEPSLEKPFLDLLLETLCNVLIRSLGDSEYVAYELQFRAILAAFTLLHSMGVKTFNSEYHYNFRKRLQARYQDLQWYPGGSTDLTHQKYLKIHCSYLLSATAQYFALFKRAEPPTVTVASQVVSLLSFGASVASPALGLGTGNFPQALRELNNSLKAVSREPNERYSGLFALQEFTRLAQALAFLDEVIKGTPAHAQFGMEIRKRRDHFAGETLVNVTSTIAQFENYENIGPQSETWSNIRAAASWGPPRFNEFYYLYGVVDCAVQVSKIAWPEAFPDELVRKMKTVALEAREPIHRWKALEYNLTAAGSQVDVAARNLLQECHPAHRERLQKEISSLCPIAADLASFAMGTQRPRSGSSNESRSLSVASGHSSQHWREPDFTLPRPSESSTKLDIRPRKILKDSFLSVGLSPDCNAVYTLEKTLLRVYSLSSMDTSRERLVVMTQEGEGMTQAALSDKYVACITRKELRITSYHHQKKFGQNSLARVNFRHDGDAFPFNPRCLSVHDGGERSWVIVAGESSSPCRPNARNGSIWVYKVNEEATGIALTRTRVSFNGFTPDPLEGVLINYIDTCPSGRKIVAVTNDNAVLVWSLSRNMQPKGEPFRISRKYAVELAVRGVTSATIFQGPSTKAYVLSTTWPSSRRTLNDGEWSYISPVAELPHRPPDGAVHDMVQLGKAAEPIIGGAASPDGKYVALFEKSGEVIVFTLKASRDGGLRSLEGVRLKKTRLKSQDTSSPSSIRFRYSNSGLELFVVDNSGQILHKRFEGTEALAAMHMTRNSIVKTELNG